LTSRASECAVEWDESKSLLNEKKHRVSFEEAATVFTDPFEISIDDPDHAFEEHRFVSIGESLRRRLLVVSYTERGDRIRIINARTPTKRERRAYEE
jgi:uncharacterized DUF497 family protein